MKKMSMKLFNFYFFPFLFVAAMAVAQNKTKPLTKSQPASASKIIAKNDAGFSLKIHAKGFADSTVAVIINPQNQSYQGPYGYVKNQEVTIVGTLPQDDVYVLLMTNLKKRAEDKYYNSFFSNEAGEVTVDKAASDMAVGKGNSIKAFDELLHVFGEDFNALSSINQAKQQPTAAADSLNRVAAVLQQGILKKVPYFIKSNNSSQVSAYLINILKPIASVPAMEEWYNELTPTVKSSAYGVAVGQYVSTEKLSGEGAVMQNFSQTDTIGKIVSLSDFKGKYVLIDFWASWCGPCRAENPNVVNAFNQYKNKNFTVLGVSLDKDKSAWLNAIHADKLTWTHVSDLKYWGNAVAQQFQIQSIPQNFLVGPDGKIVAKNLRGGVLQGYLSQLLK